MSERELLFRRPNGARFTKAERQFLDQCAKRTYLEKYGEPRKLGKWEQKLWNADLKRFATIMAVGVGYAALCCIADAISRLHW